MSGSTRTAAPLLLGRRAASAGSWLVLVPLACKPVDVPLFSELAVSSTAQVAADAAPASAPPPIAQTPPPGAVEAPPPSPDCQTPACRDCVASGVCSLPLACHPQSGRCARLCAPEHSDPTFGAACALGLTCDSALNLCVECAASTDCEDAAKPVCDPASGNVCVECVSDGDCGLPTPACALSENACVECVSNEHCPSPEAAFCEAAVSNRCVECVVDSDCANPLRPQCFALACYECNPATQAGCPSGSVCELEDGDDDEDGYQCED